MRKNVLRTEAHKLLPSIPAEHKSVRAILQCFDNTDPVDPTFDASQYDAINAARLFKDLLLDETLFSAESKSIDAMLSKQVIRFALFSAEIIPNQNVFYYLLENYRARKHLKMLLSWRPAAGEIEFYSAILDRVLANIYRVPDENEIEVIKILLGYPLIISNPSFEKLLGIDKIELFQLAMTSGCQFSSDHFDRVLTSAIRNNQWYDFIEKNIVPIHPMTEKNKDLYNCLFLDSFRSKKMSLLQAIVEKNGSQLDYTQVLDEESQDTVLHRVFEGSWTGQALLLLSNGADLSLQNRIKKTPVQLTSDWHIIETVSAGYQTGENDTFKFGHALLLMARQKHWRTCAVLLQQKNIRLDFCEPESLDKRAGWTALNYFIAEKQESLIALCYERGIELPVPEDAEVVYDLAFTNRTAELRRIISDSQDLPSYLINFAAYGAAAGNHTELLAYLKDEGAEEKFIAAGKIKALQVSRSASSVATLSAAFLPPPRDDVKPSTNSTATLALTMSGRK